MMIKTNLQPAKRKHPVKTSSMTAALLLAATLTGCGAEQDPEAIDSTPCPAAEAKALGSSPVLSETPSGAKLVSDTDVACDPDGSGWAVRQYRTEAAPPEVLAFYTGRLPALGWTIEATRTPPSGPVRLCGTRSVGGRKAYLVMFYPSDGSGLLDDNPQTSRYELDLSREPADPYACLH